jgi:hypothetical protein
MPLLTILLLLVAAGLFILVAGAKYSSKIGPKERKTTTLVAILTAAAGLVHGAVPHGSGGVQNTSLSWLVNSGVQVVNSYNQGHSDEADAPPNISDAKGSYTGECDLRDRHNNNISYDAVRVDIDPQGAISGTAHLSEGRENQDVTVSGSLSDPSLGMDGAINRISQTFLVKLQLSDGGHAKVHVPFHNGFIGHITLHRDDFKGECSLTRDSAE